MKIKTEAQRKKALAEFRKLCKQIEQVTFKATVLADQIQEYEQKVYPVKLNPKEIKRIEKWVKWKTT